MSSRRRPQGSRRTEVSRGPWGMGAVYVISRPRMYVIKRLRLHPPVGLIPYSPPD